MDAIISLIQRAYVKSSEIRVAKPPLAAISVRIASDGKAGHSIP
jgi:hypothetical protein